MSAATKKVAADFFCIHININFAKIKDYRGRLPLL